MNTKVEFRFRVFDITNQSLVGKFKTTSEVYHCLSHHSESGDEFFVDDVVDNIEVSAEEFLTYWQSGERPLDLQGF